MTRLAARGLLVDLQIVDNEASVAYKEAITFKWNAKFQLVPPDMHCQNWSERTICTFKDHFLAIQAGVDSAFPPYLWDLLLLQAELTLNLIHQAMLNPRISMWELFEGTPLGSVGCRIFIHAKLATRQCWDFLAKPGFYIGPALDSYRCFKLVKTNTKSQVISDIVKFCHLYLSVPVPSAEDKIINGLQVVAGTIRGAPPPTSVFQLEAITVLQEIFESWCALAPPSLWPTHHLAPACVSKGERAQFSMGGRALTTKYKPHVVSQHSLEAPTTGSHDLTHSCTVCPYILHHPPRLDYGNDHSPMVVSKPQQPLLPPAAPVLPVQEPIAHCTRSHAPAPLALFASEGRIHKCHQYHIPTAKSSCSSPVAMGFARLCAMHHMTTAETTSFAALCSALLHKGNALALSVLDPTTGDMLEHSRMILGTKPHGILCTPMSLAISAKALAQGMPPAPSV
jgi:hypothetical protein